MHLFDRYTEEIYHQYLDDLKVGDEVLVKCNGHEFVKLTVDGIGINDEIICPDYVFGDDGADENEGAEIMLPTTKTNHQWKVCEERKKLVDRFLDACDEYEIEDLKVEDFKTLIQVLSKSADFDRLKDIDIEDLMIVMEVFEEIVDPDAILRSDFAELNIITKILESACPE
jgi:hypothetical protein